MTTNPRYQRLIGHMGLRIDSNMSGRNMHCVLIEDIESGQKIRATVEELRDFHYITGRALEHVEREGMEVTRSKVMANGDK